MIVFPLLSIPFWLLLVMSFYRAPSRGWRGILSPLISGTLIGMFTVSVTLGLLTRTPFGVDFGEIFLWAWFRGPGWAFTVAIPVVLLILMRKTTTYSRVRELAAYLSGVALVYMIWTAATRSSGFNAYRVLLSPVLWTAAVGITAVLCDRGLRRGKARSIVVAVLAVGLVNLLTGIQILHTMGKEPLAWVITLLLAVGATILIFIDSRGYFG